MKYIYKCTVLSTLAAMAYCMPASAQEVMGAVADTLKKETGVPVAFARKQFNETLGGVSVVNVEELTKKNYNTYSLDNMQGYVGGWNGNSLWGMDDLLTLIDGVPRDFYNVKPDE